MLGNPWTLFISDIQEARGGFLRFYVFDAFDVFEFFTSLTAPGGSWRLLADSGAFPVCMGSLGFVQLFHVS